VIPYYVGARDGFVGKSAVPIKRPNTEEKRRARYIFRYTAKIPSEWKASILLN
jgi:hypothetical protein